MITNPRGRRCHPAIAADLSQSGMSIGSPRPTSVETRASWVIAWTALAIYTVSFGAPVITVVALKPIAAELGDARSVPALACSLAWFGAAVGGIPMGWMAERFGIRRVVMFGAAMVAAGLAISTLATSTSGGAAALYIGHGVFIGLLGNACINAPLYVYVARWFDRRRGSAVALISSGQYLAGMIWPVFFASGIAAFGWRGMMLGYAVFVVAMVVPASLLVFRPPPDGAALGAAADERRRGPVLGLRPN